MLNDDRYSEREQRHDDRRSSNLHKSGCGGPVGIETGLEQTQRMIHQEMEFVAKGERRNGRACAGKGSFFNSCYQGMFVHQ